MKEIKREMLYEKTINGSDSKYKKWKNDTNREGEEGMKEE